MMNHLYQLGTWIKQWWIDIGWTGRAFLVTVIVCAAYVIFATSK